ncbi:hypothetical protein [Noviherbaspirillum denitrificans]|uniref:Uncharacterized protein n=1 Tax=Noviherbaspirillum denitrificans TaxID=1968433 RepID=A0A254T7J1_9BURK|nr:hypothetical protein [Noviherbaspirillum denitrificans]OWW18619.1 hypothetical protein AYR66_03255 [Noviherbaspirillum denitrificans]
MLKQAAAVLVLIAPALGWAECGFSSSNSEMTIVVSRQSHNKCFQSEQFRTAFRDNLVASVKSMEQNAPATARVARRPRPPGMPLPVQQAEMYYGQSAKR